MPTDFLQSNTAFPRFTGQETTEQKVEALTDYTYMLLKQLRYTLNNLGVGNWNGKELNDLGKLITEPINVRLQDDEENLATLSLTVNGLSSSVSSLSGSYTALSQTVEGISLSAVSVEGGAVLRLMNGENNSDVSLSMAVTNSTGYSTVDLKSGSITLATSGQITLGGNVVFQSNLTDGVTQISGDNLLSGTIRGIELWSHSHYSDYYAYNGYNGYYGQSARIAEGSIMFSYIQSNGAKTDFGGMFADYSNSRLYLYTNNGTPIKLFSGANMSLEANGYIYMGYSGYGDTRICACNHLTDLASGQTVWQFADDGIYYNGAKKVSV